MLLEDEEADDEGVEGEMGEFALGWSGEDREFAGELGVNTRSTRKALQNNTNIDAQIYTHIHSCMHLIDKFHWKISYVGVLGKGSK